MKCFYLAWVFPFLTWSQSLPLALNIDSSYALIQAYDNATLLRLKAQFDKVGSDKLVFLHYGGSHIQAENPTSVARKKFQERFGNAGYGLMFNYAAANSYSSINYATRFTGKWEYNKSYQGRKENLPLGICGMVVETMDTNATLIFSMKSPIACTNSELLILFENDSLSHGMDLFVNGEPIMGPYRSSLEGYRFKFNDSIRSLELRLHSKPTGKRFRFYGICAESEYNSGIVYHSVGVGAAAFRSILTLEKLPVQVPLIKPDIVLLDFGTNDILYHNRIEPTLEKEVNQAIEWWRSMCPDILIVLTSTQDLFYKNHPITAGIQFRNFMDSIARSKECLFWNWYDLSGGINTIRDWASLGFAKTDHVHLTQEGYRIKGSLLYVSFINTLNRIQDNSDLQELSVPLKAYGGAIEVLKAQNAVIPPKVITRKYKVKSGDTLSEIAEKFHTSIKKIKAVNHLTSDRIQVGQTLKIP